MFTNIESFLSEKSNAIQAIKRKGKPVPIILRWLDLDNMKSSLGIIDKKVCYLRKNSESGGQGKLNQWFLSDDRDFIHITAERYIIDYLKTRNSKIEDNLRKDGVDAEINCGHEKIGIEITTLNGFVAAWILQERLMEFFDEKQFKREKTLTFKYSIERVRNEEQKNNIYNYIENIGNAITNADVASLKKMEIEINVENRNNACIVWEHDRDENYPWFRYLTSDLLRKLSEPNKQGQLIQNQKNIVFVGINEFAPPNKVIPRIFKEIGCGGISYQTQINRIKEFWSEELQKHKNITGICYFYYSLEREEPFYPLKIFWRKDKDKIQLNL